MSGAGTRLGVGTHFRLDGETVEVVDFASLATGMEVVLKDGRDRLARMSLRELLTSDRAELIHDRSGPSSGDDENVAAVVLNRLTRDEKKDVLERAGHVREMLTGYRSGSEDLSQPDEPRPQYAPGLPLKTRYEAKAAELGVTERTVRRWARAFREFGEAGLVPKTAQADGGLGNADPSWVEAAVEVLKEYEEESRPSVKVVLEEIEARVKTKFKLVKIPVPPRTTAYRWMQELERRHPTFRLSTQRNRDIADRPRGVYGKLRPTRPGEYVLMDTTRLDVFAFDPVTLRWMQAELTIAMDWYTRCIIGLRVTPVSTKAIDAAAVLYQAYRPQPVPESWPREAAWPEHGIPRGVLVEAEAVHGPVTGVWGPKMAPETLIVDHGKIYLSAHLTSVCNRMGISVQPARLRTGRDKGPAERYFRTLREDLLQRLPGYKGPDIHSRGLNPEKDAFFFHHELEAIIREWTAVTYHRRPHSGLLDPHLPKVELSPAAMFEHGLARAGYIEVPRDPHLAYEFLGVTMRTVQHYGVEINGRRYDGECLDGLRDMAGSDIDLAKRRRPFFADPDDVTRIHFRDHERVWHTLWWEHAPSLAMPLSEEALQFARRLAARQYTYPDDRLAISLLLKRWNLGLGTSLVERRMALRLSREQAALDLPEQQADTVSSLPSVARVLSLPEQPTPPAIETVQDLEAGDDDADGLEELEEELGFYATALKDIDDDE
ncbi:MULTISPECIES: helix-turn-helix domain-containing protein [Streptomyces]|uniref:Helix-turn-helix domain-containing protein n=1 Tax=Streptomyces mirabilis TaxID=68239 RepID=A0ABU3V7B4_9ACTN|nr:MULTISPECIES: helix-turn-helix domain-containing protein [Streptomyces]MCX4607725.1 helix-turn-helix domain-containing protein [Streptomyces mirabilis]MCX4617585.1 helix-turn-helix domain-containing protein [Streptomyces mirabilis]MCX5348188.1 helix-turn-helix domain-containing protein [Streptomyces mirabilis]MCX5356315.1 helix-turn-helix domain-containing protein [Streptomyces mirabilis]MCX5356940.1 helix-turn-helix domain-containing protein [Streptomyces mirabilis]